MTAIDQNSIDQLLAQVEAQANALSKEGAQPVAGSEEMPAGDFEPVAVAGEFQAPSGEMPQRQPTDLKRLLSIEVPVIVQLGQKRMNVAEVMRLGVGAIIEFAKSAYD